MTVVIDRTGPGFIGAPTIERVCVDGGIAAYQIVLYAKEDAQINISFGPITDDEDE
ncbi:MAG: hypothetical protein WC284_18215 [Candidimonas sp.]